MDDIQTVESFNFRNTILQKITVKGYMEILKGLDLIRRNHIGFRLLRLLIV